MRITLGEQVCHLRPVTRDKARTSRAEQEHPMVFTPSVYRATVLSKPVGNGGRLGAQPDPRRRRQT